MANKTKNALKVLSAYQIVGGIIGLGLTIWVTTTVVAFNLLLILIVLIAFLLYFFSIYCGIMLLRKIESGLKYSKINQLLQIIYFSVLGYTFQYASGIYFFLGLDLTNSFEFTFYIGISTWQISFNSGEQTLKTGLNLIALALVVFIDKTTAKLKAIQIEKEVSEIGGSNV